MDDSAEKKSACTYKGWGFFEPAINIKEYLLRLITKKGPITWSELTIETGIPRTTIVRYDCTNDARRADPEVLGTL